MNINKKIIVSLVFSFLLVFSVFSYSSITALKNNQTDNIRLFKNEFLELGRELFERNSTLFFDNLKIQKNSNANNQKIFAFIEKTYPREENIILIDIKSKQFIDGYSNPQLTSLLDSSVVENYINEFTLNKINDFDIDNFDEFKSDTTNKIIPIKIHFQAYENDNIIVGFGQDFLTGKIRTEFIERQNVILFQSQLTISIIIFVSTLIFIIIFMTIVMQIIVVKPLNKIVSMVRLITLGDLNKRIEIKSKDEIGQLGSDFNEMTKNLQELYSNMDKKVREQTIKIEKKVKESEDQNKAILNILEDVEESKKYSDNLAKDLEKFKLAVDNVSDQIIITDAEGIVVYGNRAVEKITGFKPEEALGKKAGFLWKAPMSIEYYQNLWDIIKDKKKTFIGEIQNKRKNGEIYTAMISISLVFGNNGEVEYYVAIERDITKEKEVDKAKTEFVSLASHQLRTPLSAINWYTEMLLAGDAGTINEDQKKYLDEIAVGNKRMVDLVDDLLNVSRLDMGTFILETKPLDVLVLIKSVLNENKPVILEKKLVVEELYGKDIPALFLADEKLMRMVFQNILSNAVKYTPPSGVVKINLFKINKGEIFGEKTMEEDSLAFSISDSGMGIPSNQQDKIFRKLFRADNAKESETEGTGLGLYVIKSIIDLSGGLIWFKSEENKGTTFWVVFPVSGMKEKEKHVV